MNYTPTDKLIHTIGFHSLTGQEIVSSITDRLYAKQIASVSVENPIFLTSLARSGTTLILNLLMRSGNLVSHTYRDMPFVLCPLFWKNISSKFYKFSEKRERAHKDGLEIGFDSEEAFEEVIWKYFFKELYSKRLITPVDPSEKNEEFEQFFTNHIRKIILNRQANFPSSERFRYLSKNNANFSRIPYLTQIFKDAVFVVPVRNPVDHVRSLMTQHRNFLEIQSKDGFAKKYMEYLGHHEFGLIFKRINVGRLWKDEDVDLKDLLDEAFWIDYWYDIYQYVIEMSMNYKNIVFVLYEHLCQNPQKVLTSLFSRLGLYDGVIPELLPGIKSCRPPEKIPLAYQKAMEIYRYLENVEI